MFLNTHQVRLHRSDVVDYATRFHYIQARNIRGYLAIERIAGTKRLPISHSSSGASGSFLEFDYFKDASDSPVLVSFCILKKRYYTNE